MTWVLSFNKQARSEIREAAHHYGLESPSLRVAFLDSIDTALAELLEHPKSAPVVRGDIRRKLIRRFPLQSSLHASHRGDSHSGGDAPEPASVLLVVS